MPVMNGWEFLEAYHELKGNLQKEINIYMVSSSLDEDDKIRSQKFNEVKDFIVKPINRERMVDILKLPQPIA
jgi:CheY-like chemotaxis protein